MPDTLVNIEETECQSQLLEAASSHASLVIAKLQNLQWQMKTNGVVPTLRKIASLASRPLLSWLRPGVSVRLEKAVAGIEALHLLPGELVEVKSKEEIRSTLDPSGRNKGLGPMPEMWAYCGKRFRVLKRVENIVFETPDGLGVAQVRKMRDTVLLEGLICDGKRLGCDRSCFFFWRERWLRRVPESEASQKQVL